MCQNCGYPNPKSKVASGVSWAVPVDILRLGPHLQAYVEVKPAIDALRLCHRFGTGPKAYITKLPLELIAMVEESLQIGPRIRLSRDWKEEYDCYQGACGLEDHFDEEDIESFKKTARIIRREDQTHADTDSDDDEDEVWDLVIEMMADDDTRFDCHWERTAAWERRTIKESCPSRDRPVILEQLKVLESDFGLSALISHQRINRADFHIMPFEFSSVYDSVAKTTVCYLTLPDTAIGDKTCDDDLWCSEGEAIEGFNVMSTIINRSTLDITEKQRLRFGRTMKLLDLKPHFHFTQVRSNVPTNLSPDDVKDFPEANKMCVHHQGAIHKRSREDMNRRVRKLEQSEWPKLMSLVTSEFTMNIWN